MEGEALERAIDQERRQRTMLLSTQAALVQSSHPISSNMYIEVNPDNPISAQCRKDALTFIWQVEESSSMWALDAQEASRERRMQRTSAQNKRDAANNAPLDLMQRTIAAARHCNGGVKRFDAPPYEVFCKEHASVKQAVSCKKLNVAGTSITDLGVANLSKFKSLTYLDLSRCFALTDESLSTIRRQLNLLQELHINDCRHFTTPVLIQLWKNCKRLHSLSARGCPAITDAFLQCIATTKRSAAEYSLKNLDIRHCKHVTSSGTSYLAASSIKELAIVSLSIGDCLDVDNMAFFGFETSAGLKDLKNLNLCGLSIDETAISWIVKGCHALESLNLSRCKTLTGFALLLVAPAVASGFLQYLNLKECPLLTDVGIKNLFVAQEKKNARHRVNSGTEDDAESEGTALMVLNLKNCTQLGDDAMQIVGRHCPRLAKLNLKGLRKVSDQGVMQIGTGCPFVASIKLSGRYISTQSFQLLGKIFRKLDALDISERKDMETPLCIIHLTTPRAAMQQSLKQINLSATNVCDVGVSIIAVNCKQLEWINLSKLTVLLLSNVKGITDKSLVACAITKLPLQVVDFCSSTATTDAGVTALCSSCQQLREIRLKGCDRVSLKTVKYCNESLLPFTKPMRVPTLSQKIATGGASATMMLASFPARHIELLREMTRHHESALVLQTRFRKWKQKEASLLFLSRRRLTRETRAAKKIQSCIGRFLSWRRYLRLLVLEKNVNKIIFVQAHVRGNFARREVRLAKFIVNRNARLIQRQYRPHYAIQMRIRRVNALEIQRVYRGFLGRQLCKRMLCERKLEAARTIWIWYRKCKNRSDFRMRSLWLMQKVRAIQGQWRKYKRRSNFARYLGYYRRNATVIQSIWRRALAKEFVKKKRIEMNRAALTIQRVSRGFATRKRVVVYREVANRQVTLIQSHWRRFRSTRVYQCRRECIVKAQKMARYAQKVRRFRGVARQALHKHRMEAAVCIQCHVRGWRGRKRALLYRKIRNAKFARKGQNTRQAVIRHALIHRGAAVVIQKWIRSVQARRKMLKIRKWRRFVAAKCIHRYMKEWIRLLRLRLKREAKIHASVNIQRVFRGYRGRVYFKAEKYRQECLKAGKLIQRMYRGFRGRCTYKQVRKEKMGAALLLQRAFRSRHTRKIYEISQAVTALKAKEKYDRSIMGWLDAKRNPMDELYRRAKLLREKAVLVALKEKWEANKAAEERAARKFKREYKSIRDTTNETIGNFYGVRRKLYGVTENVYASHREFVERKERHVKLKHELVDLHQRVQQFKAAIQEASASRRMLDGSEVFELLKAHGLFLENVPASNQDDHE